MTDYQYPRLPSALDVYAAAELLNAALDDSRTTKEGASAARPPTPLASSLVARTVPRTRGPVSGRPQPHRPSARTLG